MDKTQNRVVVLMLLLAVTGGVVWAHQRVFGVWRGIAELKVPMKVGEWVGTEIPVEDRLYEILEADSILMRRYEKEGNILNFSAVYYRDNQVGFHAPESCFGGIGRSVLAKERVEVFIEEYGKSEPVMRLKQKEDRGERLIYYFYQTGSYVTSSYAKVRMRILLEQLRFRRSGVALFEIVASVDGESEGAGIRSVEDFVAKLIPVLPACFQSNDGGS